MANYRLTKVSETCHKIQLGRDTIGWCRRWDGGAWEAKANSESGVAKTAGDAFRELVRALNNAQARKAGFANAGEQVDAHNAQVRKGAEEFNSLMRDALGSLAPAMQVRVRSRGRILV